MGLPKKLLIYLVVFNSPAAWAQFANVAPALGIIHQYAPATFGGGGVSFADWDGDGWDDLSICQANSSCTFYHNEGGTFQYELPFFNNSSEVKQLTWVDYDNDGDRDLFVTRYIDTFMLLNNDGNMNLTNVSMAAGLPETYYQSYGHCWGDYDRDGYLDLYICNYNISGGITNLLYHNNGNGTFTETGVLLGVDNGVKTTFCAIWTDYNRDYWPDLFIANDRATFHNYMYKNNGDGTFTDVSAATDLDYYIFAMNASADDFDNDGDLDIYVTNEPFGNLLHRNNGDGTFTEVGEASNTQLYQFCWGAQFIDAENDGWLDLHVTAETFPQTSSQNRLMHNNADGTFTDSTSTSGMQGDLGSSASAQGDFNNDGYMDLAVIKDAPGYSGMWQNNWNQNNWIKITPEGVLSNKDGIGCWIDVWTPEQHYVRYTYCGESFLSQNSFSEIFGIGESTAIDSIAVYWPSGHVDHLYNQDINQSLNIVEGSTLVAQLQYTTLTVCDGQPVTLNAGTWDSYLWSNGYTGQFLTTATPGNYYCVVENEFGFSTQSNTVAVIAPLPVDINAMVADVSCYGINDGQIDIDIEDFIPENLLWSNDQNSASLTDLSAGVYSYTYEDQYGCVYSDDLVVSQPDSLYANFSFENVACYGESNGTIELIITNASDYTLTWNVGDLNPEAVPAGNYTWEIINSDECVISGEVEITQPDSLLVSVAVTDVLCYGENNGEAVLNISGGTPGYAVDWQGADSTALGAGNYPVTIIEANDCSTTLNIEVNQPDELLVTITYTYNSETEQYEATANVTGGTPLYDYEWNSGETTQVISAECNQKYSVTILDENGCTVGTTETCTGINEDLAGITITPNPFSEFLLVEVSGNSYQQATQVTLTEPSGRIVLCRPLVSGKQIIQTGALSPGIYFIQISGNASVTQPVKLLKQ